MTNDQSTVGGDITLKDVVISIGGLRQDMEKMGKELSGKIDNVNKKMSVMKVELTERIDTLETNLTERVDALEEDLTATIKDTIVIRRHTGMSVPDDE